MDIDQSAPIIASGEVDVSASPLEVWAVLSDSNGPAPFWRAEDYHQDYNERQVARPPRGPRSTPKLVVPALIAARGGCGPRPASSRFPWCRRWCRKRHAPMPQMVPPVMPHVAPGGTAGGTGNGAKTIGTPA